MWVVRVAPCYRRTPRVDWRRAADPGTAIPSACGASRSTVRTACGPEMRRAVTAVGNPARCVAVPTKGVRRTATALRVCAVTACVSHHRGAPTACVTLMRLPWMSDPTVARRMSVPCVHLATAAARARAPSPLRVQHWACARKAPALTACGSRSVASRTAIAVPRVPVSSVQSSSVVPRVPIVPRASAVLPAVVKPRRPAPRRGNVAATSARPAPRAKPARATPTASQAPAHSACAPRRHPGRHPGRRRDRRPDRQGSGQAQARPDQAHRDHLGRRDQDQDRQDQARQAQAQARARCPWGWWASWRGRAARR